MKKIVFSFMLAMMAIITNSCNDIRSYINSRPENFQEEIEDYVKFTVSEINYTIDNVFVVYFSSSRFDAFDDEIRRITYIDNSKNSYEKALYRMANNTNNQFNDIAKSLLNEYQNTRVVLSDYRKIPTSSQTMVWEFTEINTGILFQFSIDEKTYAIKVDDDSAQRYLEKNLGL